MNSSHIDLLRISTAIADDAMTSEAAGYKKLVEAACLEAGPDVPAYMATLRYLHKNLNSLLIETSSEWS